VKSESLKDRLDNKVMWRLVNWGAYQRAGFQDGPHLDPKYASWQNQILKDGDKHADIEGPPPYIDELDGAKTQTAMIEFKKAVLDAHRLLTLHYRDGLFLQRKHRKTIRIARNLFWRWL